MRLKCCSAPAVSAGRAPTSTVAPHKPLALRSNLATAPGRTSSNKQSQPRRPAALQTPLPSRPALRGEDRTPTPAQPSTAQGRHTQPRRGSAVCWNGSTYTAAAALSLGAARQAARHEAHEAHAVPQPRWQQHFHPLAVPEERSSPVPRCSSPQHCSGCIGLLQARGIYTEPAWMVPINGRLYLAKAGFSFPEERKSVKRPEEGGRRQAQRWGASEEGPGCVSTGGEHSLCPAPPAPAGLSHTTA